MVLKQRHVQTHYTKKITTKQHKKIVYFRISTFESTAPRDDESQLLKNLLLGKNSVYNSKEF